MLRFHSLGGFSITIMSVASGGIGSVGTSAEPVLPTTILTSSNSRSILDACMDVSRLCDKDVPCGNIQWNAKSPSCSVGMNSPPILEKINTVIANISTVAATKIFLNRMAFSSKGV